MAGPTPQQRKLLIEELGVIYPAYDDLELFLDLELGQRLAGMAAPDRLPKVIWRVITAAHAQGWLTELVAVAAAEAPHRPGLQRLAAELAPGVAVAGVAGDPVSYDMHDHEQRFRVALHDATSNLIGVAVPAADEMFLKYLHQRLAGILRGQLSTPLTLDARHGSVAVLAQKLGRNHDRLRHHAVVAPVWAARIPDAGSMIAELWGGIGTGRVEWPGRLVVVFAVDPDALGVLPPDICPLPAPAIDRAHLISWVGELVAGLPDWPHARSQRLVNLIYQRVLAVEEELRLYTLYDELERQLRELCENFHAAVAALDVA